MPVKEPILIMMHVIVALSKGTSERNSEDHVSAQEDNGINQSLRHLSDPSLVLLLSK